MVTRWFGILFWNQIYALIWYRPWIKSSSSIRFGFGFTRIFVFWTTVIQILLNLRNPFILFWNYPYQKPRVFNSYFVTPFIISTCYYSFIGSLCCNIELVFKWNISQFWEIFVSTGIIKAYLVWLVYLVFGYFEGRRVSKHCSKDDDVEFIEFIPFYNKV